MLSCGAALLQARLADGGNATGTGLPPEGDRPRLLEAEGVPSQALPSVPAERRGSSWVSVLVLA